MAGVQLPMVVMMVCFTCMHITRVSGQQSTEAEIYISINQLEQIMRTVRQEITDDVMRTTRQEITDDVMRAARQEITDDVMRATRQEMTDAMRAAKQEMTDVMRAARQEMTDVTRAARQEMTDVMKAARQETEELRTVIGELTEKLEGQNSIIERLAEMLESQSAVNEELRKKVEGQNIGIQKLELENLEMKQHFKGQKVQIEGQNMKIEGQKYQIEKFEDKQVVMTQQIEGLIAIDKRHDDVSQQIAFSVVSHHNFGPVTLDTNVEYEIVHTNVGDGWLPLVNAFQAPAAGVYMITASMLSYGSGTEPAYCKIVHNTPAGQTTVASMRGQPDNAYGDANSVIIELAEDDVVSVQLWAGDRIIHSNAAQVYSTFSGFLIFT